MLAGLSIARLTAVCRSSSELFGTADNDLPSRATRRFGHSVERHDDVLRIRLARVMTHVKPP